MLGSAFPVADGVALALLLAFGLWGLLRGPVRQLLSLLLLAGAFPLATHFGPGLEDTVVRVVTLQGADIPLIAWTLVFLGVLLAGGLLLALLRPLLRPRDGGSAAGALLGLVHGAVVLTVLGHGLLIAFGEDDRPGWVRSLAASRSAQVMRLVGQAVEKAAPLPAWLEERLGEADRGTGS